jgi:hypothetical protein
MMSVAKSLVAGHILEEQLCPYPQLRQKDQEVLRMMVDAIDQFPEAQACGLPIKRFGVLTDYAERRVTQATGVGRDKISTPMPQLLRGSAGINEKYTVELAKASDFLLRMRMRR